MEFDPRKGYNKGSAEGTGNSKSDNCSIRNIAQDMKKLLQDIAQISKDVDEKNIELEVCKIVVHFLNSHHRFLYSETSEFIYFISDTSAEESSHERLILNLDRSYEYICLQDNEKNTEYSEVLLNLGGNHELLKKSIYKLYDHVNLAFKQSESFYGGEEKFKERAEPIIYRAIDIAKTDIKDNIYTQLISIVAIFTAISFVMFGGISLLNNLFNFNGEAPMVELICLGSLIGLILIIVIYIFIAFVLEITNSNYDSNNLKKTKDKASLMMLTICLTTFSLWLISKWVGVESFLIFCKNFDILVVIVISVVVVVLVILWHLIEMSNLKKRIEKLESTGNEKPTI